MTVRLVFSSLEYDAFLSPPTLSSSSLFTMSNTQSTDGFKEGDLLPGPRVPDPPLSRPPSPPPQPDFELKRLDSSERVVEEESLDVTLTTMDEVPELVEVADESMVDERIAGSEVETPLSRRRKRPLLFEGAMELEVAYKALNMSDTSDTSDEAVTKSLIIALVSRMKDQIVFRRRLITRFCRYRTTSGTLSHVRQNK